DPTIEPWSNAVGGRAWTACQAVSAGMRGSISAGPSAREAVARKAARGVPPGVAAGFQLLKVRDVGEIYLGGQVPARGRAEALARAQGPAGQRPASLQRRRGPPPEQDIPTVAAALEGHREHLVTESLTAAVVLGAARRPVMCWHVGMILCCAEVLDYEAKTSWEKGAADDQHRDRRLPGRPGMGGADPAARGAA